MNSYRQWARLRKKDKKRGEKERRKRVSPPQRREKGGGPGLTTGEEGKERGGVVGLPACPTLGCAEEPAGGETGEERRTVPATEGGGWDQSSKLQ